MCFQVQNAQIVKNSLRYVTKIEINSKTGVLQPPTAVQI